MADTGPPTQGWNGRTPMLAIHWNRWLSVLACLALTLVLVVGVGFALAQILHTLVLFMLAAVLALLLLPLVDWGERRHVRRWIAVVATYIAFVVAVGAVAILLFMPLAKQARELASAMPAYLASLQLQLMALDQSLEGGPFAGAINAAEGQFLEALANWNLFVITGLINVLSGVGGLITDGFLILIISIYMLIGGRRIHSSVQAGLSPWFRARYLFTAGAFTQVAGRYVRGQTLLALLLGVVVTIGLTLLGMPHALVLGLLAMTLGVIPMFGSALSAVPALLVALTQPPPMVLWVLIFFIVVQNVQDQVLAPRISGHSVGLHPLAVLFALLAGAELGGALGAILAVPVAAFTWIVIVAVYRSVTAARGDAAAAELVTVPPTAEAAGGSSSSLEAGPRETA